MKTSLIAPGYGAAGVVQAGMIKAFLDQGRKYDSLHAASAGSLNGSMTHAGQIDECIALWKRIRSKDVFSPAPWNAFRENYCSFFDASPLRKTISQNVDLKAVTANPVPFFVNVTNFTECSNKHWQVKDDPELLDNIWASACPPVAFPLVKIAQSLFTDGGITNNYSVSDAVNQGADRLIVMAPPVPYRKRYRSVLDSFGSLISMFLYQQLMRELKFVEKLNSVPGFRHIDVIVIRPDEPVDIGLLDFDVPDKQKWIDLGYRSAWKALEKIDL